MKQKVTIIGIVIMLVMIFNTCTRQSDFPVLKGPYLGQKPPGMTPEVFAPGIVSTGLDERDMTFSPDGTELYYTVRFCGIHTILMCRVINNHWTKPEVAPFSGRFDDVEPFIHPDGTKFYFVSRRPVHMDSLVSKSSNIWMMVRDGEKWGIPKPVGPPINGNGNVYFPTLTNENTMYFTRREPDGSEFIYRSKYEDDSFKEPEKLPPHVNTTKAQFNACISPDEKFLIIPVYGREDSEGSTDYYITFRDEHDQWSQLLNMGHSINNKEAGYSPSLTPNGKYFFFQQKRETTLYYEVPVTYSDIQERLNKPLYNSSDIFWVDAKIIEDLRPNN